LNSSEALRLCCDNVQTKAGLQLPVAEIGLRSVEI